MTSAAVGVVGHVEWVDFAIVEHVPAPGEIVVARETFADTGGGGGVAAVYIAQLAGTVQLFTAIGSDALGAHAAARLRERGVTVHAAVHDAPQPRALTHLSDDGERTITVLDPPRGPRGSDELPWHALAGLDAAMLTAAGDPGALYATRSARLVVATARVLPGLREASIGLDVLVLSAGDPAEVELAAALERPPEIVVATDGARGGSWRSRDGRSGRWAPSRPPGPPVDAFGCGDAFAAALTLALAAGRTLKDAIAYAARAGALVLTGRGPYGADLRALGPPR